MRRPRSSVSWVPPRRRYAAPILAHSQRFEHVTALEDVRHLPCNVRGPGGPAWQLVIIGVLGSVRYSPMWDTPSTGRMAGRCRLPVHMLQTPWRSEQRCAHCCSHGSKPSGAVLLPPVRFSTRYSRLKRHCEFILSRRLQALSPRHAYVAHGADPCDGCIRPSSGPPTSSPRLPALDATRV